MIFIGKYKFVFLRGTGHQMAVIVEHDAYYGHAFHDIAVFAAMIIVLRLSVLIFVASIPECEYKQ